MRAYVLNGYDGSSNAQLTDVEAPTPRPHDILVAVRAAGLNPVDFMLRQGGIPRVSWTR